MMNVNCLESCKQSNSTHGLLQPGIPSPSLLSKVWTIINVDLKVCFFTMPLQEQDREIFAFTVTIYDNVQSIKAMSLEDSSPANVKLYQNFVNQPLEMVSKQSPWSIIYHYMKIS